MNSAPQWRAVLRDATATALVAGLVFQACCRFVGERYGIPTDSMQPILHGDAVRGDVVYVDKLASAAALQRYDLAVLRAPEGDGPPLVKRVVAFGDEIDKCWVELADGDLWLGPDAAHLERERKDPRALRDLRVTWCQWPPTGDEAIEHCLSLPLPASQAALELPSLDDPGSVRSALQRRAARRRSTGDDAGPGAGWLFTVRPVDASYLDACGRRRRAGGGVQVQDCGMDLSLPAAGVRELFCGIDLRPETFTFHVDLVNSHAALWRDGETVLERSLPLRPGTGVLRVEFGFLDGRFFLLLDDREDALWLIDRAPDWARDPGPVARPLPKSRLSVAGIAGATLRIERLCVFRDLYYYRDRIAGRLSDEGFVPAGHVFVLGDNSFDSRDSRMFGPLPLNLFVGRPRAILGPPERRRMLPR